MIISDLVFNRMKELGVCNGVFLLCSNDKEALKAEAISFPHRLLDYTDKDVPLNEKIFNSDSSTITVDIANEFVDFERKKAVGVKAKILVLYDIDLAAQNVSDKLLKSIEDFNSDSLIVLTTTALENVSNTIRSRAMVFKEFVPYLTGNFTTSLSFMDTLSSSYYTDIPNILATLEQTMAVDVIQALFESQFDMQVLAIAKHALDLYLTGSKDNQIHTYIVNSLYCLNNNIRSFDYADSYTGE